MITVQSICFSSLDYSINSYRSTLLPTHHIQFTVYYDNTTQKQFTNKTHILYTHLAQQSIVKGLIRSTNAALYISNEVSVTAKFATWP